MNKRGEIGGGYWLSREAVECCSTSNKHEEYFFVSKNEQHLSTCRTCLSFISERYEKKVIIVPYFTCNTVVDPFIKNGWKVLPYFIDENLRVDWIYLKRLITQEQPSIVLFHSYFGFPTINDNPDCISWIKESGIHIINDITCSLLSSYPRILADYCVGSIRKWFPIPDGALLEGPEYIPNVNVPNVELVEAKLDAFVTKHDYLCGADIAKKSMLDKFAYATKLIDAESQPFCMSHIAKLFLTKKNVEYAKNTRRQNYNRLYEALCGLDGIMLPFPSANSEVVPYLFPIIVDNRNNLQKFLAENDVYATVLWTKPQIFCNIQDDLSIYEKILCLPISQCYNVYDMDRIVSLIKKYLKWI